MLLKFKVKNFMSIKEELEIDMAARYNDNSTNSRILYNDQKLLKSMAIFGANASGKSNVFKAFTMSLIFIRNSNMFQENSKLLGMIPFKFDNDTVKEPCFFEYTFIANNTKYIYGFSADFDKVYEEYLYKYSSSKPSKIFERKETNKYEFTTANKSILTEIKAKNTDNKLFLSTLNVWNYEDAKEPFNWLMNNINTYSDFNLSMIDIDKYNDERIKTNVIKLLRESDLSIIDYKIEIINRNFNEFEFKAINLINSLFGPNPQAEDKINEIRITTVHEVLDDAAQVKTKYTLDLSEESAGTQKMFLLGFILQDVLKGGVIIIDELENGLHPFLVEHIIKMFNSSLINKNNSQLIFTTHSTRVLNLDEIGRDQVLFVEKNEQTAQTEIFSLSDFSVRKDDNIEKNYINGRYGAVPFIEGDYE